MTPSAWIPPSASVAPTSTGTARCRDRNSVKLRIGAEASAWLEKEARSFTEFLTLYRAVPVEVGATLPDGGIHAEGILETMDGEILQIAIRKYFR